MSSSQIVRWIFELLKLHLVAIIRLFVWCIFKVLRWLMSTSVLAKNSLVQASESSSSDPQGNISDRDWDLISICIYTEFCIDQLRIPLGVQSTDATANGGLAPKPPEPGWYPQCLPLWLDSVSIRKDTQSYEYFSLCYDDPAPGQG